MAESAAGTAIRAVIADISHGGNVKKKIAAIMATVRPALVLPLATNTQAAFVRFDELPSMFRPRGVRANVGPELPAESGVQRIVNNESWVAGE